MDIVGNYRTEYHGARLLEGTSRSSRKESTIAYGTLDSLLCPQESPTGLILRDVSSLHIHIPCICDLL